MRKRLILYIFSALIILSGIYILLISVYPKMAVFFPVFIFLILIDAYLWNSIKNKIFRFNRVVKKLLTALYWLPFIVLLGFVVLSLFIPHEVLMTRFSTYLLGVIMAVYISKILPSFFLALSDIFRVVGCIVNRVKTNASKSELPIGKRITRSKFLQNIGLISGGIVMSGFIMGIVKWATDFRVIRQSIYLSDLPSVLKGLKIVQISDLHLGSWASNDALEEAVEMIYDLQPDLVFFTGDIVNYTTSEAFPYEPILAEIDAKYGVFSVLGNHDYGEYVGWDSESDKAKNLNDLIGFYDRLGWTLLRNDNRVIEISSAKIGVVGVENWSVYSRFLSLGDLNQATKGMENVDIKLLLSHDPSHWEHEVLKDFTDIDITFSGHTHGFQFGVEMPGIKWSPAKYLYKHWAGLYSENSDQNKYQYLYVNRGLGNIGYPGRIGILPEITLVELA